MERIRRRFFKVKPSSKPKEISPIEEEGIYLEPQYDESSTIALHIDIIAEELLAIAKKSVRMFFDQSIDHTFLSVAYHSFIEIIR